MLVKNPICCYHTGSQRILGECVELIFVRLCGSDIWKGLNRKLLKLVGASPCNSSQVLPKDYIHDENLKAITSSRVTLGYIRREKFLISQSCTLITFGYQF